MINNAYLHIGNQSYYAYSLYYADSEWHTLLPRLCSVLDREEDVYQYMFFLSYERGAHIRILVISYTPHPKELRTTLNKLFETLLKKHPSVTTPSIDFQGKELWMYHLNNSVLSNTFKISGYTAYNTHLHKFSHFSSKLLISLIDNDLTEENRFSIALYLYIQLLRAFSIDQWGELFATSNPPTLPLDKGILLTMQTYWEEDTEKVFAESLNSFYSWKKEIRYISLNLGINTGFNFMLSCIKEMLGLSELHYDYAIRLLYIWQYQYKTYKSLNS